MKACIPMWSDRARQWVWIPTDGPIDAAVLDMLSTEQRQKVESLRVTLPQEADERLLRAKEQV